jgi:hypothetical protein
LDQISPLNLQSIIPVNELVLATETTEVMMARFIAAVSGAKAVLPAGC